jgi:hypothetical protein
VVAYPSGNCCKLLTIGLLLYAAASRSATAHIGSNEEQLPMCQHFLDEELGIVDSIACVTAIYLISLPW